MKQYKLHNACVFFMLPILFALASCSVSNTSKSLHSSDTIQSDSITLSNKDSVEYELFVMDIGFIPWFNRNARSVNFYSHQYYHNRNLQYVSIWNSRVGSGPRWLFCNRINYNPHEKYPIELDHKLFWYFRYVQWEYGNMYSFFIPNIPRL